MNEPTLVETVMATIFAPNTPARVKALRENHERNVVKFGLLSDAELVENAAYYLKNSQRPGEMGSPVYDVVMHDVIIPELIKRVGGGK